MRGRMESDDKVDRWSRSDWWGVVLDAPDARALAHFYSDLLGWEWEMGLHDPMTEQAAARGVKLVLRQIPRTLTDANHVVEEGLGVLAGFLPTDYPAWRSRRQRGTSR